MNIIPGQIQYAGSYPVPTSTKTTTGYFPIEIFEIIFSFANSNDIGCLDRFWNERFITIIKNDTISQIQHSLDFLNDQIAIPTLSLEVLAKASSIAQIKAAVELLKDQLRPTLQTVRLPCLDRLKKSAKDCYPFAYDILEIEAIICRIENAEWYYWVRHKIPRLLIQNIAEQASQTCDLAKINKIMGSVKPESCIRDELNHAVFSRLCLKFLENEDWTKMEMAADASLDNKVRTSNLAYLAEKALQGSELQQARDFASKVPDKDVKASLLARISQKAKETEKLQSKSTCLIC